MKVLQIAPPWIDIPPKGYGGTEWVIFNLNEGLHTLGHEVTLFATKDSLSPHKLNFVFDKSLIDQGLPWHSSLPTFLHYHQAVKTAHLFDIVHAHLSSPTDLLLLPLLSDLKQKGIPNLVTLHTPLPIDGLSNMDQDFINYYGRDISIVNISKHMQKKLSKQFHDAGVVHNSIHTDLYKYTSAHKNYLTWLGKFLPNKGLLEAIQIAKKTNEKLIFAGVVDTHQKASVEYFEQKIKPLIDGIQIQYIGPVNLEQKNELLRNAKAFLYPLSWEEPFGMVLIEALACGTPVITYPKGATTEIVKHGKTGFLAKNEEDIIKGIKGIHQINRKACRIDVEENFSPIAAAKSYLTIYQNQLNALPINHSNAYTSNRVIQTLAE